MRRLRPAQNLEVPLRPPAPFLLIENVRQLLLLSDAVLGCQHVELQQESGVVAAQEGLFAFGGLGLHLPGKQVHSCQCTH